MEIEKLIVGQLQTNCYLVYEEQAREGVIIDPGDDAEYILNRIRDLEMKPLYILATHGHFDHVLAVLELKTALKIPFLINEKDLFLLKRAVGAAKFFTGNKDALKPLADKFILLRPASAGLRKDFAPRRRRRYRTTQSGAWSFIKEDDVISFGSAKQNSQLKVIETPGHSPGGVVFFGRGIVFSGDTLFKQGMGTTQYSYCSETALLNSIKNKLFKLPDETIVYPGHGEETTIREEKENFPLNK